MDDMKLIVRLRSIARLLESTEREGTEPDEPEGSWYIKISDTCVRDMIVPALDAATLRLLDSSKSD